MTFTGDDSTAAKRKTLIHVKTCGESLRVTSESKCPIPTFPEQIRDDSCPLDFVPTSDANMHVPITEAYTEV